ncbi:hypothetical protein JVU11DRAFT_10942 [Chiua virens]|nr:hypothetical protein JVU11DRAFT_10942 [Chiua virens]
MFVKLSTLALALPLVSALTINPITGGTTGGTATITWTASTTDPNYFSIELVNTVFHNTFAIANNVQTSLGSLTIQLPQVPVGDVNTVYSQSGDFSIAGASSTTSASGSVTSASSSTGSVSSTGTLSATSPTGTTPVASAASSSASGTASGTSASTSPSSLTGGAAPLKLGGVAPAAALLLSAVAGAAMVF